MVIDIGLPDRRGDALLRELRALDANMPIVLAPGRSAEEVVNSVKGYERIAFVTKPYTAAGLVGALHSLGIRGEARR